MTDDWKRISKKQKDKMKFKEAQDEKTRLAEEKKWQDNDKTIIEKENRRLEKEKKQQEELERRKQNKEAQEEEQKDLATISKKKQPTKISQAEIEKRKQQMALLSSQLPKTEPKPIEITENPNHIEEENLATDIDSAISMLEMSQVEKDMHAEKRVKAAFNKYVEDNMERIKAEFKNLKRSQQVDKLWKEFKKSEENPLNQQ